MHRRAYIYRNGATDACALTAIKDASNLPLTSARECWRFWMQIGPLQAQGGRCGFDIRAALPAVAAGGYYLFTGAQALLGEPPMPPLSEEGPADA